MKLTNYSLKKIQRHFPELHLFNGDIQGEIIFSAMYLKNKRGQWVIESCNGDHEKKCVKGNYQIKIILDQEGKLIVFETGGKIATVANRLGIPTQNLHIENDGSCCLDFAVHPQLNVKEFILNKVYPFFVWQAYYEKFEQVPPCGEYSHGMKAKQEFIHDVKKISRNDICFCGSGKKHKKCCLFLLRKI